MPEKVYDSEYRYRGYYDAEPEGICRVRLFRRGAKPPVLVITDPPENPTTSVTNLAETLVPEIIRDLMPNRFEYDEPVVPIEHLPPMPREGRRHRFSDYRKTDQYSLMTFATWRPRKIWLGGRERLSLGEPDWSPLAREAVSALIGEEEVEPSNLT